MRRCTMSKKKDPKLYELILDWTQSGNLLWKRLDDEETNDPFVKRATDDMNIDLIESFYTNISSGTIYVISDFGGDPALFVQPNGGAALTEFDVSTPQINQLKNAIKDQVDDVTEFIESLEKWSDFFISFKLLLLLEQLTLNQRVPGSSPCWCTKNRLFGGGFLKAVPKRLICSEDSRKDTSRLETQKHRELQLTVFLDITTFFDCAFLKSSDDFKQFYASVECLERGLSPMTINLVVADVSRSKKTICLAAPPILKVHVIPGRARLFE